MFILLHVHCTNVHEDISIEQEQKAEYTEVKRCVYV